MSRILIIGYCILQIAILVQCNGLYSVVGPGTLRSKSQYHVTVSVHDAPSACKIKVGLTGPDLNDTQTVEIAPKSSKIVKFDIPKIKDGDYNLTAEGISGIEFQNSTKLNYAGDQRTVYIQTDKATYKPGDKIQFRVLVLDENTRPAKLDGPVNVVINDGARNRIKQWNDVKLTKGVYAGELQLSEFPVLGSWNIEASADGTTETKNFDVDKYVLPKFEVQVEAPKDVAIVDGKIRVTVRSKYTYGKPVKGKAVVSAKTSYYYYGGNTEQPSAEKTVQIDGKGHVEFDIVGDLKLDKERYAPPLTILAIVEEELTGLKQNSTATVTLHREKYQIQGVNAPYTYYPGKPVTINVVVKNLDGSPVQDTKNLLTLSVSPPEYYFRPGGRPVPISEPDSTTTTEVPPPAPKTLNLTSNLDKDGMAKFEVTLPDDGSAYYSVKASYLDSTSYVTSLSKFQKTETPIDESLKITVQTKNPSLGQDVSIKVSNAKPIPYFVYTIVGRGDIIQSGIIEVPENRNYHVFKITPTFEMIPRATIMIHYIVDTDLLYDETSINFEKDFENSISIDIPAQAKPGEEIKLKVSTDPDSYVGLLGVDQSVLLLKSGNDLKKDTIFQDLGRYDTRTPWSYGYGLYPGTQSGVVTMTNANFPFRQNRPVVLFSAVVNRESVDLGPAQAEAGLQNNPAVTTIVPVVRKEFPETWIIEDFKKKRPIPCIKGVPIFDENNYPNMLDEEYFKNFRINVKNYWMARTFLRLYILRRKKPVQFHAANKIDQTQRIDVKVTEHVVIPDPPIRHELFYDFQLEDDNMPAIEFHILGGAAGEPDEDSSFSNRVHEPQSSPKMPTIRKLFPENWIFSNNENTDGSGITLSKKVPDTITSWVVSGFSLNPKTGLALTDEPSKLRVFQPFFVSTNLPYSVKRGEVISIPVIIFNYLDKNLDAEVTLDNADKEFEFTEATNEVTESASEDIKRTKTLTIPSNSGKSISFMIRPKIVGQVTLKITAISPLAGDAIHQSLKVEPEGVTTFVNKAIFLNLIESNEKKEKVDIEIPDNAVPDSQYIELSVVGDLLGPTIKNLDKLVRMPYGCGEQNMVNFVPNILVLKYLNAIKQLSPEIEEKAKKFLEIGYQRELQYKHDDGSYSAFGKSDASGSTWLTAYVVKSFHQAIPYTDIDPKIIEAGLQFLASKQADSGEFPEVGKVIDSSHSGGSVGLSAFVLLAFLENIESADLYKDNIEKGLDYLESQLGSSDDQYSLAIAGSALLYGKRNKAAEKVYTKLDGLAKQEGDRKWWSKTLDSAKSWYGPRSVDVEITSYIVLAWLEKESAEEVLPIIRWLISQRNSNGGFSSTQDTVVGLQALIKFAEKSGSGSGNMEIEFTDGKDNSGKISVTPETSLILQTHVLPKTVRGVEISAKGNGSSLAQISYRYNLADKDTKPSFTVKPTVKDSPKDQLALVVCTEFVPLDGEKESNMAVMEVALPSGYTADADSFGRITDVNSVKRVETKNSDSVVIVYFDSLSKEERCIPVDAIKSHAVAKQKPAPVVVYDYYDNNKRATDYYEVKSSLCDICEGDDCGAGCAKKN